MLIIKKKDPRKIKGRGMDFYYDVIDWIGGYPYEYISIKELNQYMEKLGFTNVKTIPWSSSPIANNEFIYKKNN